MDQWVPGWGCGVGRAELNSETPKQSQETKGKPMAACMDELAVVTQLPPLKSICEAGLSENAPQAGLESKTVAENSLLKVCELTMLNKLASCE